MERARGSVLRSTWTILRREFVGLLRSRKGFWISVLTVAGTSLIPLVHWPDKGSPLPSSIARDGFDTYRRVTLGSLLVFVPLVAFTSMSDERKRGTMVMLLSTPLRPAGIVLGKILSTAGFFLLLVVLTFPMAAVLYLLGGFEAREFADALGLECVAILFLSTLGLWPTYLRGGHALLFFLCFLLLGPLAIIPMLFLPDKNYWRDPPLAPVRRPPPSRRPWQSGSRAWPVSRVLSRAKQGIPDGWNPVFVAAFRSGIPAFWTYSGCLPLLLACCFLLAVHVAGAAKGEGGAAALLSLVSAAFCPALACNLVMSERSRATLDLLRATPLRPFKILAGKLQAVLVTALPFPLAGAMIYALLWMLNFPFLRGPGVLKVPFFLLALSVTILHSGTAGLLGAVLSRTGQQGMVLSYLLSFGYLLALPCLSGEMGLSPLTALKWSGVGGTMSDFPLACGIGLELAGVQFALAVGIFELIWVRER